ncbi:IclR family transcriptional regulator [Pseudomonas sp. NA-150]|uniref:IclR family transcriptional regulator n=1 Tax=Pseudomonas sp. NA-150 TaxID=3367525 RepID=UPI0037C97D8E
MKESAGSRNKGSSITRVMEIIEAVAQASSAPSPADLAFMLDIPKPSLHRLLQQIQAEGFLQTNLRGAIVPSERLHHIAMGVIYASRYKAQRQAILRQLAEELDETCGIAMPDGIDMVYHDRVQSSWPLQLHLPVGTHVPMWCTASGKLYLSTFSESRRRQIIESLSLKRMARNTLTQAEALEAQLKAIRKSELAVDNEEFVDGMVACAVPIKDRSGRLFACLYTHAPTIRKSLEELLALEPQLRRAASRLGELVEEPPSET